MVKNKFGPQSLISEWTYLAVWHRKRLEHTTRPAARPLARFSQVSSRCFCCFPSRAGSITEWWPFLSSRGRWETAGSEMQSAALCGTPRHEPPAEVFVSVFWVLGAISASQLSAQPSVHLILHARYWFSTAKTASAVCIVLVIQTPATFIRTCNVSWKNKSKNIPV